MLDTIEKSATHPGKIIDHVNGYDIISCESCGFRHVLPLPDAKQLEKIYQEEYYTLEKPDYFKHYEEDKAWWQLCYDDRYDYFEQHLLSHQRKIIDVGSGPGLFLLRGKERGWETLGIEPSHHAAAYSQHLGLTIRNEFFNAQTKNLTPVDVIHMSAVLEHIPHPQDLLTIAHRLLNPGGLICVVVPNDYNPFQNTLRKVDHYSPWWLAPPHHINYFTPSSLQFLLEKSGFTVTETSTTFPIDIFLLMGENYTKDSALGRQCQAKRKRFEMLLNQAGLNHLRRKLYQLFAECDVGREIVLFAQKPST